MKFSKEYSVRPGVTKGQIIKATLYYGDSSEEALTIYNYAENNRIKGAPIPLTGIESDFKITETIISSCPDFERDCLLYRIEVKGELI